ncbi:hypothetical protein [Actinomadura luteofluorescens]
MVLQQPLLMCSDMRGEPGVDGVAVGGLKKDGRDRWFGEPTVSCRQDFGKGFADAGCQFWDGKGVGVEVGGVESVGGRAEAFPVEDGQFRTGEVGPVEVAVGEGPVVDGGVDARFAEVARDGAVYVVLADDAWTVVRNRCGRDCARSPVQSGPPCVGQGDVLGEVRSRGADGRRYVGAELGSVGISLVNPVG